MKTIDKDLELAEKFFYSKEGGWYNLYLKTIMCEDLFDKLEKVFGKNLNYRYYSREEGSIALVLLPSMWLWVTKFEEKYIVNRYFVVDDEHVLDNQLATSSYDGLIKLLTREISNALDTSGLANASKDSAKPKSNSTIEKKQNKKMLGKDLEEEAKYTKALIACASDFEDEFEKISENTHLNYCEYAREMLDERIALIDEDKFWEKFLDKFRENNPKKKYTAEYRIRKILNESNLDSEVNWLKIAHLALMKAELISWKL